MNMQKIISNDKIQFLFCGIFALAMIGLAVIGGIRSYTPVPHWDMWDGIVNFILQINGGHYAAWWNPHNEHRIVLSRLLFWINYKWLGETAWLLIVINYLLICGSVAMYWKIIRDISPYQKQSLTETAICFFVAGCLFFWSQKVNITSRFQSQFILAQLLPLCAFYFLHRTSSNIKNKRNFILSCTIGVASVCSMANGLLALPLMTVYAIFMRLGRKRIIILIILSVISFSFYLYDFSIPEKHSNPWEELLKNPYGLFQYVMLYLGSPFTYLFRKSPQGILISFVTGLFLVSESIRIAMKLRHNPQQNTLEWALLFFIVYILCTAMMTATGRLSLGLGQALSGRYTTPALMAWIALLALHVPGIMSKLQSGNKKFWFSTTVLALFFLSFQFTAAKSQYLVLSSQKIAALALTLQVKDQKQINIAYPEYKRALEIAKKASDQNISIFATNPFKDARTRFGKIMPLSSAPPCDGAINQMQVIPEDRRFIRIGGWVVDSVNKIVPKTIYFLTPQGKMVGYALTGVPLPSLVRKIGGYALCAGYLGYLQTDQIGKELILQTENPSHQIKIKIPDMQLSSISQTP